MASKRQQYFQTSRNVKRKRQEKEVDVITLSDNEEEVRSKKGLLDLPSELLERIFGNLNIIDLQLVVNRVCSRFDKIIKNRNFMAWNKVYYRQLIRAENTCQDLLPILPTTYYPCSSTSTAITDQDINLDDVFTNGKIDDCETCLEKVILFMDKFRQTQRKKVEDPQILMDRLKKHPLFETAAYFLHRLIRPNTNAEEGDSAYAEVSVWCYMSCMVLMCDGAAEIHKLLRSVTAAPLLVDRTDVMESLFCLATLLLECHRRFQITPQFHYNLLSAIFMSENSGGKGHWDLGKDLSRQARAQQRGQMSLHKFLDPKQCSGGRKLTFEQFRVINYELEPKDCVRIIAYAGTGKTTTLREYVKAHPGMKFLVLMYNRSVSEQVKKTFPKNAKCQTTHQWALHGPCLSGFDDGLKSIFQVYGMGLISHKNLKVPFIAKILEKKEIVNGMDLYTRAKQAIKTLHNFFSSVDPEITTEVTPDFEYRKRNTGGRTEEPLLIPFPQREQIRKDAALVWEKMIDPGNDEVKFVHDGYLKLFQLKKPKISGYDAVLIDEAQDMNPATLDTVLRQDVPKIFVGDPNQQIYAFRGAVDALEMIKETTTRTFFLTQSFRFGPQIAFIANCWLEKVRVDHRKLLIGVDNASALDGTYHKPMCIITRYNATLFNECIKACRERKHFKINGGPQKFGLDDIEEMYWLSCTKEVRAANNYKFPEFSFIARFQTLEKLRSYANRTYDLEMLKKIGLVDRYREQILVHIKAIKQYHTTKLGSYDYIMTTAHMAKGMEFDSVCLAYDFDSLDELTDQAMQSRTRAQGDQAMNEFNLVYVAMTRAKKRLVINSCLYRLMSHTMFDPFEYMLPFATAVDLLDNGDGRLECQNMGCRTPLPFTYHPHQMVLCRRKASCLLWIHSL